jgi:hypothetical protein
MREVCSAVQVGMRFIAFSAFIDDTAVVEYRGRSVTPFMLVPMNVEGGVFEVVGFVPYVSDADALASGVKKSAIPVLRSGILQKCISVVLAYGLMRNDSPKYVCDLGPVRNVLVSLRLDHKARLEALALVGLSKVVEKRNPACRRHEIRAGELSRVLTTATIATIGTTKRFRRSGLAF